jgi:hypothetical protein
MARTHHTPPAPIRVIASARRVLVHLPTGSTAALAADLDRPLALAHAVGSVKVREFHCGTEWSCDPHARRRRFRFDLFPAATSAPDWGDDEGDEDVLARCGTRAGTEVRS